MLVVAVPAHLAAQALAPESLRVQRLAELGRLWGAVKYFHPAFLSRDVNWDSAVVAAIPKVSAARSTAEYAAAVNEMLGVLADPVTRVVGSERADTASAGSQRITWRWETDSTLVVFVPGVEGDSAMQQLRAAAVPVRAARRVVFDLRGPKPSDDSYGSAGFYFSASGLNALLPSRPIAAPAQRQRMYSGFPPQAGQTSGGYWSATYELNPGAFTPPSGNPERRLAFVIDATSDIPPVAWALQNDGAGAVVLDGARGDAPVTGATIVQPIGEGVDASLRVGEWDSGSGAGVADTVLRREASDDAPLRAALDLVRAAPRAPRAAAPRAAFVPPPERSYADMHYPASPYRVLAAYRWWNAIHYFYPYKDLMGEDWGAVLRETIPRLEVARDSAEYALAVAEMVARIHDSHGYVASAALRSYFGPAPVGVLLQYVQGRPVVVRVADDSATGASGIRVGDVVLRVDGEDATARRARFAPYIAHSTPQALDNAVASRLLGGPEGSTARLLVSGAGGRVREVALPRRVALYQDLQYPRTGPILRVLPGNIGYADLARLTVGMVDSMFTLFRHTSAIILDDRGYPQGTAWAIAPRLTDRTDVVGARFRRPLVMSPDTTQTSTFAFAQTIPKTEKWRYHGATVMLMDERTISQAEHTGLFLEAANHTTFVGSPTQGANGDITNVVLPGGITAGFTGHDVRHADGRQLQRVGLVPNILVRPTIAGIRAGRDEVLERALRYLRAGGRTAR